MAAATVASTDQELALKLVLKLAFGTVEMWAELLATRWGCALATKSVLLKVASLASLTVYESAQMWDGRLADLWGVELDEKLGDMKAVVMGVGWDDSWAWAKGRQSALWDAAWAELRVCSRDATMAADLVFQMDELSANAWARSMVPR